jgi:hypothetical protein
MTANEGVGQLFQLLKRDRRAQILRLHKSFEGSTQMHPLFKRLWYDVLSFHDSNLNLNLTLTLI